MSRWSRPLIGLLLALTLFGLPGALRAWQAQQPTVEPEGKAKELPVPFLAAPVDPAALHTTHAAALPAVGFAAQTRLGYTVGDQWEPAIAADRYGHVYNLYPQYGPVPGCAACVSPSMVLQISNDGGTTWQPPTLIDAAGATAGQWDAQIVVDPVDGRTVYAAWLQNNKSDIAVAKSTDFGITWSQVLADATNAGTDKPILIVRGADVYVAFNHAQKVWVAASHDSGATFTNAQVNANGKLGWSLAGGGAVTPNGTVYFSWAGYKQNGGARGDVYLYVSKSTDGGATWTTQLMDTSGAPPTCPAEYGCGWAYLGAQLTLATDAAGTLYALWNANAADFTPNRMYFAKSNDGVTWTPKVEVSTAPVGVHHNFPAITAGTVGDVRIAWMDARAPNSYWNVYYRSSTNSGASWSAETDISDPIAGYAYINNDGFRFPFGDYFEIDLDAQGVTHALFGEGNSYDSPGSIWYTRGR